MSCFICQACDNVLFKTKHWRVSLCADQAYLGRCYVSALRHVPALSELNNEEIIDFLELSKILENVMKKSFGATMFNWTCLMNDAYKEENPNPHVHWHFRPRYKSKVVFQGVEFIDPEFASHFNNKRKDVKGQELLDKIIEKIKGNLQNNSA